jgi:diguanylate cyclase (GGDEF)-like protein
MFLALSFYSIALVAQLMAAIYAIYLFFLSKSYRFAFSCLAIGLTLMIGRRLDPLLRIWQGGEISIIDAVLAVIISGFLLVGMFQIKKLLNSLEEQNFLLGKISKEDPLTSALSRSETFARSELEIQKSFRSKKSIAFMMADIDHFKSINDVYGHPIGDIVLTNLVKVCQKGLREIDIFGRVGGEEFLIVLPETESERARQVAERLRLLVSQTICATTQGLGLFMFDPLKSMDNSPMAILKDCYEACDKAMYRAKQAGRNQISL